MSAVVQNYLERLEARLAQREGERDLWKEEAALKAAEAEAFMLQRDALAAHVERMRDVWQAEALDDAAEAFEAEEIHLVAAQALRRSAHELRRQAEEPRDD